MEIFEGVSSIYLIQIQYLVKLMLFAGALNALHPKVLHQSLIFWELLVGLFKETYSKIYNMSGLISQVLLWFLEKVMSFPLFKYWKNIEYEIV